MRELTKQKVMSFYDNLTVGELKEFINTHNLPDTSKILIQRVADIHYEKHGFGVLLREGDQTTRDSNGGIVKETMEQYHPAWSCVKYEDDDLLFIDLHY